MLSAGNVCVEAVLAIEGAPQTTLPCTRQSDKHNIGVLLAAPKQNRPTQIEEQLLAAPRTDLQQAPKSQAIDLNKDTVRGWRRHLWLALRSNR